MAIKAIQGSLRITPVLQENMLEEFILKSSFVINVPQMAIVTQFDGTHFFCLIF